MKNETNSYQKIAKESSCRGKWGPVIDLHVNLPPYLDLSTILPSFLFLS